VSRSEASTSMERGRGARGHGRRCVEARVGVDAELPHRHYRINLPGRTDRGLRGMVVRWRSSERLGEWRDLPIHGHGRSGLTWQAGKASGERWTTGRRGKHLFWVHAVGKGKLLGSGPFLWWGHKLRNESRDCWRQSK